MKFAEALHHLLNGKQVKRAHWKNCDFVTMMTGLNLPPFNTQDTNRKVNDRTAQWIGNDRSLESQAYFASCKLEEGKAIWQPGWTPSTEDLLADDWEIYSNTGENK
jgi:hypothetical protein